jgi:hypothetical protein
MKYKILRIYKYLINLINIMDRVNCDEIYALCSIDKKEKEYKYGYGYAYENVYCFSFDKQILYNIIENNIKKNYIIKKIKYYSLEFINNDIIITRKILMNKNNFNKCLYAFNKISINNNIFLNEQVLLNITKELYEYINQKKIKPFFKNISNSLIFFDKYYEKSIMNP